jgi:hypothetical protein
VAEAAALVLALVFVWAAVAKVRARTATIASFSGLRLPAPAVLATVVPLVEVGLAIGLVLLPGVAAFAALVLLLGFSIVIGRAVAAGAEVGCACFGGGAEARPVSVLELVRNAGLAALAIVASGAGVGVRGGWPSLPALVLVTVVVALGRVALAAVGRRRWWRQPLGEGADDGT